MNTSRFQRVAWWPLAALLLLLAGACSRGSELEWTEDVKLPDGRVVALKRYTEFKGGSSQFGEPSTESLQRIAFKHPATGEVVRWETTKDQGFLNTVALWLEKDTPVLLTEPAYSGDHWRRKCPNPPYLLHEYVHGQWRDRDLAQIGIDRIRSNMTSLALEKRQYIESNKRRLSAEQTSDSDTVLSGSTHVPYVIRFKGMPTQTFGEKTGGCSKQVNYLIQPEEK